MMEDFSLSQDTRGRLHLRLADGMQHEGVVPVRAFPLSAPDECIALVTSGGHEVVNIARLSTLAEPARSLEETWPVLREVARDLERYAGRTRSDPNRLAEIEERLYRLEALLRLHGPTLADVLAARARLDVEPVVLFRR